MDAMATLAGDLRNDLHGPGSGRGDHPGCRHGSHGQGARAESPQRFCHVFSLVVCRGEDCLYTGRQQHYNEDTRFHGGV